jgi:hypothetical protein
MERIGRQSPRAGDVVSTAGPNACGTTATSGSGASWSNPDNIKVDDSTYARSTIQEQGRTLYLHAKNFGFAIPTGSTITDVSFSYIRKTDAGLDCVHEYGVYILDVNGAISGTNKAAATFWTLSEVTVTKAGNGAYWGVTLTPDLINNVNFGVGISAINDVLATYYAYIDYVSCTITYTPPLGVTQKCFRGCGNGMFRGMR